MASDIQTAVAKLIAYCEAANWAGHDPYDALNSRIVAAFPLLNSSLPRLALTQALKRSPVSLRRPLLIPKTQNPKAIGLFLTSFINLSRAGFTQHRTFIRLMIDRLAALRSPGLSYYCWGYSFPWQTRTVIVPAGQPNLICTAFAASALLDAYEDGHGSECLTMAVSAAEYILDALYWTSDEAVAGFSYPISSVQSRIHNANFIAAALLSKVHHHTGQARFLGPALAAARYSAAQQRFDGSWEYGESPSQAWIDNFHTGYNLCALRTLSLYAQTAEFDSCVRRGYSFYRAHFVREDGAPRYYHDRTYPIDIHCVAQTIITLLAFEDLDSTAVPLAHAVWHWAMTHLWDDHGYFYYRVLRFCTVRISYMRWSQAWMLLAMSQLLLCHGTPLRQRSPMALMEATTC
jgi:hypothetical protein